MPTPEDFARIGKVADIALEEAFAARKDRDFGAVNWGDLIVVEVLHCQDEHGNARWRILIEEASPDCGLPLFVYSALAVAFPTETFDVATEW